MSATEIIALIEKLPPAEQAQVRDYLLKKAEAAVDEVRRVNYDKAIAVGEKIFDRHDELFRKLAQ